MSNRNESFMSFYRTGKVSNAFTVTYSLYEWNIDTRKGVSLFSSVRAKRNATHPACLNSCIETRRISIGLYFHFYTLL